MSSNSYETSMETSVQTTLFLPFRAHLSRRLNYKWAILIEVLFVVSVVVASTFHVFICFSCTIRTISTKLGTKYTWVKVIQVYPDKEPHPFTRGYNNKIVKMHWKFSSPELLCQFEPNLTQSIFGWRVFRFVQMKGHTISMGKWYWNIKNTLTKFKKSSPEPLGQFKPNLTQSNIGWRGLKFLQVKTI